MAIVIIHCANLHQKVGGKPSPKGWSGSWKCRICGFEEIDKYEPGN